MASMSLPETLEVEDAAHTQSSWSVEVCDAAHALIQLSQSRQTDNEQPDQELSTSMSLLQSAEVEDTARALMQLKHSSWSVEVEHAAQALIQLSRTPLASPQTDNDQRTNPPARSGLLRSLHTRYTSSLYPPTSRSSMATVSRH